MFHLVDPNDPDPFGNLSDTDCNVVCQGRVCRKDANGIWINNGMNSFLPVRIPLTQIEVIGDTFLSDKSGWFDRRSFEFFALAPKYLPMLGDASGPKDV